MTNKSQTMAIWREQQGRAVPARTSVPVAKPGEVTIGVKAFGINRADLVQLAGHYPPSPGAPAHPGLEVAGVVITGHGAFKTGDAVMALLPGGGYGEVVCVDAGSVLPLPDNLSFAEGAAIPETFITAYQVMFDIGRLQPGQSVLLHAGASGVGTSAIQLAKAAGAKVAVTCGSNAKIEACLALGADWAINYRDQSFEQVLPAMDLIIDPVGGDYLERNLRCLQPGGTLVQLAFMGGRKTEIDLGLVLAKRLKLLGSTLRSQPVKEKARLIQGFWQQFGPALTDGRLKPVIDRVFPASELALAHARMAANGNIGKLVVDLDADNCS